MMHPQPTIQAQIMGAELPKQTSKIEYQLKSNTGRVVMTFDENCHQSAKDQAAARNLPLFRVTTIIEQI